MQNLKKISNKELNHSAFTMIELVFVIVVLGILAAVAVPKFAATRKDAEISKGKSDIASIRTGIVTERQARLIQGVSDYIPIGTATYTATNGTVYKQMDNGNLFGGILTYGIPNVASTNGKWSAATAGSGTYVYRINNVDTTFTYTPATGIFACTAGADDCDLLTQ